MDEGYIVEKSGEPNPLGVSVLTLGRETMFHGMRWEEAGGSDIFDSVNASNLHQRTRGTVLRRDDGEEEPKTGTERKGEGGGRERGADDTPARGGRPPFG